MANARRYIIILIMGSVWGVMVPLLWPDMDSFSNIVAVVVGMPIVLVLAHFLNRALPNKTQP